jgi:hypothetical protein
MEGSHLIGVQPKEDRTTVLHELQHAVQNEEGFARGWNPRNPLTQDQRQYLTDQYLSTFRKAEEAKGLGPRDSWENAQRWIDAEGGGRNLLYDRSAGEIEARNVQSRRDMTPEQRRAAPPWTTEDVPREWQIMGKSPAKLLEPYLTGPGATSGPQMSMDKPPPFDPNAYGKSKNTYTPGSNENIPGGGKGTPQEELDASLARLEDFLAPLNKRDKLKVVEGGSDPERVGFQSAGAQRGEATGNAAPRLTEAEEAAARQRSAGYQAKLKERLANKPAAEPAKPVAGGERVGFKSLGTEK